MTRALVTSSKYSPGNMTPEALESLFVGRDKMLDDVLKRLAASALGKEKHYFLLVGARGMGKTHFVALLHHRLSHDPAYATARKRLLIAYLNEEEWGVASFLDLLVRILRALAANDPALTARIEPIYTTYAKDPSAAQAAAQALLVEYVSDRTLLLICENLIDLFEGLGEEGQKRWRAFIQEHPFWTILATTTQMFGGVQLHKSPFYGFFTVRHLDRLDFETAALLLRQKALIDGRTDLANVLGTPTGRARVRAIHHLAGGNHRAYVTLSDFLTRESLDDLVTPFMRMVDDMTPYYQDQIRQLAPQQRKLVEFLSHTERPTIVKNVASRCLISQQTAAKQLGELARLGFVERTKSGRETYYEISEPLMRICIEVKDNRTEHIKLFVSLLREWFSGKELRPRLEEILHLSAGERSVDPVHFRVAAAATKREETDPFSQKLLYSSTGYLEKKNPRACVVSVIQLLEHASGEHLSTASITESISTRDISPDVAASLLCSAYVGASGFAAGLRQLSRLLKKDTPPSDKLTLDAVGLMVRFNTIHRGVRSTIGDLDALRSTLAKHGRGPLLAEAATDFIRTSLHRDSLDDREWISSFPLLKSKLADIPECEMPLAMLSVGIRHVQNNDQDALLELPLEQRTLLLEAIVNDPPPKPEEPALDLPPLKPPPARRTSMDPVTKKTSSKAASRPAGPRRLPRNKP